MAQRTIASFFKAPTAKPAGGAAPLRELTESDVNTRKRDAPHGDGGCVVDHDERAPRGKRLSAPRSFEKGADVVSVPGTSGGTVSRPGDRPTRSLELVVVDGRDYLLGRSCFQCANLTKPAGDWRADDEPFAGGIFCAVKGTNRVVSGHVLGDRLLMYDVPRIDEVVASMCVTCEAEGGFKCGCDDAAGRTRAVALHSLPPPLDDVHGPGAPHMAVITQSGELKLVRIDEGKGEDGVIDAGGPKLRVVETYLLTEGTFKYAFPEGEAGVEAASDDNAGNRLGACVAWRDPKDADAVTAAYKVESPSDWWAPVTVAVASRTGSLCFLRLGPKASPSNVGGGGAELVRTVHPHLPRDGARDARIHDAALWERAPGGGGAVVTAGGDGNVAVTHFDQTHSDADTAWQCVDKPASRATRVAVCERYATAVTGSVDEDDASVWDLRDERRVRKFRLFDGERVKGFDRATYTLRGLAIGGSGRLVGVSNTNRVDDATMQLVRGR
jgi:hypothetical protein